MSELPAPPDGISPSDWEQTPAAIRALVQSLQAQVAFLHTQLPLLQARVAALQTEMDDLETRLGHSSGNFSHPRSSDPPSVSKRLARPPRGRRRDG